MHQDEQEFMNNHFHPLKEEVAVLKTTVAYQEKMVEDKFNNMEDRMGRTERLLNDLTIAVSENHDLVKKIWWLLVGGALVVGAVSAVIKFILPLVGGA